MRGLTHLSQSPSTSAGGSQDDSRLPPPPPPETQAVCWLWLLGDSWRWGGLRSQLTMLTFKYSDGRDCGWIPSPGYSVLEQPPTLITGQSRENTTRPTDGRADNDNRPRPPRPPAQENHGQVRGFHVHPHLPSAPAPSFPSATAHIFAPLYPKASRAQQTGGMYMVRTTTPWHTCVRHTNNPRPAVHPPSIYSIGMHTHIHPWTCTRKFQNANSNFFVKAPSCNQPPYPSTGKWIGCAIAI